MCVHCRYFYDLLYITWDNCERHAVITQDDTGPTLSIGVFHTCQWMCPTLLTSDF